MAYRVGSLCSGYGGLDIALQMVIDGAVVWTAENDPYASAVLQHNWPDVPNLGDITAIDWPGVDLVDILTAGYPCQPFSLAGQRRGDDDARNIWPAVADAVRLLRPRLVVLENVASHLTLGFGRVQRDLATLRYDTEWMCLRAADVGAPHLRDRLFVLAVASDADRPIQRPKELHHRRIDRPGSSDCCPRPGEGWEAYRPALDRWAAVVGRPPPPPTEPGRRRRRRLSPRFVEWLMGLDDGHVTAVDLPYSAQIRILGNGVVPQQAAAAVEQLLDRGCIAAKER